MGTDGIFRSARLWSGLVLALSCLALCFTVSCEGKRTIVNGLDEKEANEIVVFLAAKGIDASKLPSTVGTGPGGAAGAVQLWDISVRSGRATEAMAILNMNGLPRRRGQSLLGLFQQSGLVPSEMEEKIRFQAGLAEQIASTIRKVDGVLDADIQLSFPEEDPLNPGQKKGKVTASVYVKHQGVLDDPNTHLITKIKRLVASSILGLDYDNVTVISDRARFSDISLSQAPGSLLEEEKDFVRVWSIVIGKETLTRFRVIFFTFFIVIMVMGLSLVWILWKVYPLVLAKGNIAKLLSLEPLVAAKAAEEPAAKEKEAEEGEELPKEEGEEEGEEEVEEEHPETEEVT